MNDVMLGKKIEGEALRDAIHVAIAPVEAGERLHPADHVCLKNGRAYRGFKAIGIVDPFLKEEVEEGERFWLCLYQKTITGMRHCWSHPEFGPNDSAINLVEHEKWIRDYAAKEDMTYETLMAGAEAWIRDHSCTESWSSLDEEFWTHYNALTGQKGSGDFFQCCV